MLVQAIHRRVVCGVVPPAAALADCNDVTEVWSGLASCNGEAEVSHSARQLRCQRSNMGLDVTRTDVQQQLERSVGGGGPEIVEVAEVESSRTIRQSKSVEVHGRLVRVVAHRHAEPGEVGGSELIRQLTPAIEEPHPVECEETLLRRDREGIDAELLHVGVQHPRRLCGVDHAHHAPLAACLRQGSDVRDESGRERHGRHRYQTCALVHRVDHLLNRNAAVVRRHGTCLDAEPPLDVHPRIDVVRMLDLRAENEVVAGFPGK